jgi:hypothetical protein
MSLLLKKPFRCEFSLLLAELSSLGLLAAGTGFESGCGAETCEPASDDVWSPQPGSVVATRPANERAIIEVRVIIAFLS